MSPFHPTAHFVRPLKALVIGCSTLLALSSADTGQVFASDETAQEHAFFENKIRPVLVQHCYKCHSSDAKAVKGGLLVDSRAGLLKGGESGAAVIPKNVGESLLLNALKYEDYEMPPSGQLSESVIADFEKWIEMGAPDPRLDEAPNVVGREIDLEAGRNYWAFRPIGDVAPPKSAADNWSHHAIDQFIFAKWAERGLEPVSDADLATWFRRVKIDLVGLPPTPEELVAFQAKADQDLSVAKANVVDDLLASRHFGERWGRHWLDLARYAESTGRTRNFPFPFAWRYRDYVIQSFNDDKPYDQFVIEQLAGDLLARDETLERTAKDTLLTATGYLAVGSPDLNERNPKVFQMDMVADQIDTMSRSMLGLTVGCARCHDHKFDPIPTEDYYALAGIFQSTQLLNGYATRRGGNNKARNDLLISLGEPKESSDEEPREPELTAKERRGEQRLARAREARELAAANIQAIKQDKTLGRKERNSQLALAKKELGQKTRQFNQLRRKLRARGNANNNSKFVGPACLGVREAENVGDCRIHIRGEISKLGDKVPRGVLQVVAGANELVIPENESGRLQLAQWIASPNNPLTARVLVNRVWRHLTGKGIVRTVDNFGEMGARPTHPKLLDYLANQFMANGWSIKWLIREIVLTRTYGLSVGNSLANTKVDANNELLWRMNPRRLDFEALRDSILAISGRLNLEPPTGSMVESMAVNEIGRQKSQIDQSTFVHRSVYLPIVRNLISEDMSYFDFPDPSETRGARDQTNVPTQSLYLLNSPFVVGQARAAAKRLQDESESDDSASHKDLVEAAYRKILGRSPSTEELARASEYMRVRSQDLKRREKQREKSSAARDRKSQEVALSEVVHAMFASAEFRYR